MSKLRNNFNRYASYYDFLYQNKPYVKECDFLEKIFKKYSSRKIKCILDLGCGTGKHDFILAERGYRIWGIDISSQMIGIAKKKNSKMGAKIKFFRKDIRKFNLGRKFGAAIAMFGVFCYLPENKDLFSTLRAIDKHLKKGALLIFDCWFGPAVVVQKPREEVKVLKMEDGSRVIKKVKPRLDILSQTVDLKYNLSRFEGNKVLDSCLETHKIRFFFPQEIKCFLEKEGFRLLKICPPMQLDRSPTEKDWGITVIARKI